MIAQKVSKGLDSKLDFERTGRMVTFGVLLGTPLAHHWYNMLDRRVMPHAARHPQALLMKARR